MGENKQVPRVLSGGFFGYVDDAFSQRTPELPCERGETRAIGRSPQTRTERRPAPDADRSGRGESTGDRDPAVTDTPSSRTGPHTQGSAMFKSDTQVTEVIEVKQVQILDAEPWKDDGDSAQNRLLIKGGQVVNEDQVIHADVYIEEGIIKQVGLNLITPGGARIIEAKGKYVIPGGVDTQTHFQQPVAGTVSCDDFYTGTRAALAGGTTTVLDVVMPERGESLVDAHDKWAGWAEQKACCDYGLHVGVTWWSEKVKLEMAELVSEHGVNSFKMFMAFKDQYQLSDAELLKAFNHCKQLGAVAQVHAENGDAIKEMTQRLLAVGVTGPEGHELSRPEEVEAEATQRACLLAHQVGCPLHIAPVMSRSAAEVVAAHRRRGQLVSGEATAAALATDGTHQWNRCWRHAAAHVTCPPLRPDPATPQHLAGMLANNDLQCASSNHCSFTVQQKEAGQDDFTKIPQGVNGVEDRMAVLWEKGVASGKMDLCQFVAATSTNAAKLFNIYPQKGVIAVGSDADIVIWDPTVVQRLSAKTHQQRCDFSVFEGLQCRGAPAWVLSRGRLCLEEGQLRVVQGAGRRLSRAAFPPFLYRRVQQRDLAGLPAPVNRDGGDEADQEPVLVRELNGVKRVSETMAGRPPRPAPAPPSDEFHNRSEPAEGVRNQQNSGFAVSDWLSDLCVPAGLLLPPGAGLRRPPVRPARSPARQRPR
ncbi:dihydropyrimidinase-like isoform X1 [Amphibalanus amphitrite]|uniref:dihydropyrimidinase-like isoform X1 n=2 Tax=Amphibalanus amphitrite TaxID=1232801 RepID=UPI001C92B253|nr:dihydropyrimidinase-like isoform X1 [Amphibalanus amphitrite]